MSAAKRVDRHRHSVPEGGLSLPSPFVSDLGAPCDHILDEGLEDAANAALDLGQPLLLTGEPGTGKTQFAHFLAWHLGLEAPLEFHTKSTSTASDLFYSYDTVRRFHAAHTGKTGVDERDYVRFNALGRAMLRSLPPSDIAHICPPSDANALAGPVRSVVLIDEIDKASRDFPNDLLNELSTMSFQIPELGKTVVADRALRPIVVVTSNQERPLPDAFLRRCVFYCIEAPTEERMVEILARRFGQGSAQPPALMTSAAAFYSAAQRGGHRPPSVAELIGWFYLLLQGGADLQSRVSQADLSCIAALAKTPPARKYLGELLKSV
jgi:MoxR-like ATPase